MRKPNTPSSHVRNVLPGCVDNDNDMRCQVKNPSGDVVGVLDIAKCLYDAVSRLEKASNVDKSSEVAGSSEGGLQQSVLAELGKSKGKKGKAAMAVRRLNERLFCPA